MKHGKNPTREQKRIISDNGLNPDNWFVSKIHSDTLELRHRLTDNVRVVKIWR